ncbi:MAG: TonB-dependent receptor [Gemmatimonadota bacterium]
MIISAALPKVAFSWRATDWLMFRGAWSEAFRAPNLVTVNESLVVRNNTRTDWTCMIGVPSASKARASHVNP